MQETEETVDITPSPRVLRMLGQIDFKPWQCLAELIDNAIDAFLDQEDKGNIILSPMITVSLPSFDKLENGTGELEVSDNGVGMSLDQLQNAVRAGYSGNDPVEKMGLFGMGFNISTARLGRRTEVWTTTVEASEWVGVVIDFAQLEKTKIFSAPVLTREKTEFELQTKVRGTKVKLMKLEPDRLRPLIWGAGKKKTRTLLGKIYGRVMDTLGITILYDGDNIKPWRHCTWDATRFVPTKSFGDVPARIEIDEKLASRKFCTTCWVWLNNGEEECPSCGLQNNIIKRQRRLKGWIGIQRYFDKNHYGFDLIRNGRVIEQFDKSLFHYESMDGDTELEYPIDAIHWGGRIVGELEIDFVRVSHQKDSFDKLDPEWKYVVEIMRGNSPLRPQIAQRLGLEINRSPLARLFSGYRSGYAGLKHLVPGDANGGINGGIIREWVDRFYNGEQEYQNDAKWYELVLQAEQSKRGGSSGGKKAGGKPPIDDGDTSDPKENNNEGSDDAPEENETPVVTYETDSGLSRVYQLNIVQTPIALRVNARRSKGLDKPFLVRASGSTFDFDYNLQHPFFEESLDLPVDCLLVEMAHHFLALSGQSPRVWPVSIIERMLRDEYFPETLTNISRTAEMASALLVELREHFNEKLPDVAPIDPVLIDTETLNIIRRRALLTDMGDNEFVNEIIITGQFAKYVGNKFLIKLIGLWPKVVMDSEFFTTPYETITSDLQAEALQMLINGMDDVWWLAGEGRDAMSKDLAWRLRYGRALASMRLVQSWRS
jgi:hypothetical protein